MWGFDSPLSQKTPPERRDMRLLLLLAFLLCSCSRPAEVLYERSFHAMGSRVELRFYCRNEEIFLAVTEAARKRMEEIDRLFSNYRDDSVLAEVNRYAGVRPVTVPPEFVRLTRLSTGYSELTDGAFDITVGGLYELWKEKTSSGTIPSPAEIERALECSGYRKIGTDAEKSRIFFTSDCLRLDFGAVGKGYAVDEITAVARKNGITRGLVNFGGSVFAMGSPDGRESWDIRISGPGGVFVSSLELRDRGAATSGGYERYFESGGRKYSHVIDPRTGRPAGNVVLATAISKTAAGADAFSTAVSVLGAAAARAFAESDEFLGFVVVDGNGEKRSYFGASLFPKR